MFLILRLVPRWLVVAGLVGCIGYAYGRADAFGWMARKGAAAHSVRRGHGGQSPKAAARSRMRGDGGDIRWAAR